MTAVVAGRVRGRAAGMRTAVGRFWAGISAVSVKELRSRMRGRRAFVVVTIYLLLLSLFAFGVYHYLKQQAVLAGGMPIGFPRGGIDMPFFPGQFAGSGTALSANIGHGIFGGLLMVETLLVVVLAPALTSGAISIEREKQTIDLLVTTPLSTLGMVIGKLFSALVYVFLLIIASIPLASVVFVFGGVGPEDLVRGYVLLFALAFGMGAIGLFASALVRRTLTAFVAAFVTVLVLSFVTVGVHLFWSVASRPAPSGGFVVAQRAHTAPEALLWLNPFVADVDLVCTTAPGAYHHACAYLSFVTGKPYFGSGFEQLPVPGFGVDDGLETVPGAACPDDALCDGVVSGGGAAEGEPQSEVHSEVMPGPIVEEPVLSLGFPRDTFWPKSAAAFVVLGTVLTLLSAQLVAPTRRLRLPLPALRRRRPSSQTPTEPSVEPSAEPSTEAAP